jgi:hypothetical protein
MRRRSSGEKPAATTWLPQYVTASMTVWRQRGEPSASTVASASSAPMRASWVSSSSAIQPASNTPGSTMRNRSDASVVSGVPGRILRRSRSLSSLTNAVRGAKP